MYVNDVNINLPKTELRVDVQVAARDLFYTVDYFLELSI